MSRQDEPGFERHMGDVDKVMDSATPDLQFGNDVDEYDRAADDVPPRPSFLFGPPRTMTEDEVTYSNRRDMVLLAAKIVLDNKLVDSMKVIDDVPTYIIQMADKFQQYAANGVVPEYEDNDDSDPDA